MFSLAPEYNHKLKQIKTPGGRNLTAVTASARTIYVNVSTGALLSGVPSPSVGGSTGGRVPMPGTSSTGKRPDGKKAQMGLQTIAQLASWPKTPAACDGEGGTFDVMKALRENLNPKAKLRDWALVAGFPTTTTRDSKGTDAPGRRGALSLCEIAAIASWSTPQASDNCEGARTHPDSPQKCLGRDIRTFLSTPGPITDLFFVPTGKRVVLAPEFSLWLMGFPEAWVRAAPGAKDWLEAQAKLELECSRDRETPSSPSLPPSSCELLWRRRREKV